MTKLDKQKSNLDISALQRQKENKVRNYYNRLLNFTSTNDSSIIKNYKTKSYKTSRTKKQIREPKHRPAAGDASNTPANEAGTTSTQRLTMKKLPVILND